MYTAIEDIWCRWCILMMRTRMEIDIDIDIERNAGIKKGCERDNEKRMERAGE